MIFDFSVDGAEDHGPAVLDNGLPDLPDHLEPHHGIAVARWVDGDFGVVKVVSRNNPEFLSQDHDDDDDDDDEYDFDVQPYVRINGEWEATNGAGGSGWYSPPFVRYPALGRYSLSAGHEHQQFGDAGELPICVIDGVVGEGVTTIEIVADGRTIKRAIESPIGAWVAGFRGNGAVRWIARDDEGRVAAEGDLVLADFAAHGIPHPTDGATVLVANVPDGAALSNDLLAQICSELSGRNPDETYIESTNAPDFARIVTDFNTTTGRTMEMRAYPAPGNPESNVYEFTIDSSVSGSIQWHFEEQDAEQYLVELVDQLCEQYLHEEVWGGWPICPAHHTHPLDPVVVDNVAVWLCPTNEFTRPIGQLSAD